MTNKYNIFLKKQRQRQKEYRERKRAKGYKDVLVNIPGYLQIFIKGTPWALVDAYIEANKNKYIEMEFAGFIKNFAILKDDKNNNVTISDPEQITKINNANKAVSWDRRVRLYVDGTIQIISKKVGGQHEHNP